MFLDKAEKSFLSKKAKMKHLLLSDRNSTFFHSIVKRNNSRNFIYFLCREDDSIIYDQEDIAREFVSFYTNLFRNRMEENPIDHDVLQSGPCLNDEECMQLIKVVSEEEINEALHDIGDEKAPS